MEFKALIVGLVVTAVAASSVGARAQGASTDPGAKPPSATREETSPIVGKWAGTAKNTGNGDISFTMELKSEGGKISGTVDAPQGILSGKDGTFADGTLSITFALPDGMPLKVMGKLDGEWLRGEWEIGQSERGSFECKRVELGAK